MTAGHAAMEPPSLPRPGASDAFPETLGRGAVRTVRVVLVRHGESRWNASGIVQGQACRGLSERGFDEAERLAVVLQQELPDAAAIVRSDLQRVAETARPYERATGLPVIVDPRLRELDTGRWTGKRYAQVAADHPDEVAAIQRGEDVPRGGGESFAALASRACAAFDGAVRTALDHAGEQRSTAVIVFTHGGPIRVGVGAVLGLPRDRQLRVASPPNASLSILDYTVSDDGEASRAVLATYGHPGPFIANDPASHVRGSST